MAGELQYPMGTLIGFESGEYSDFRFDGMLVSLRDLDLRALAQEYVAERRKTMPKDCYPSPDDPTEYMAWLVAKGHAAPVNYSTVYLGSSSSFDDQFDIPEMDDD